MAVMNRMRENTKIILMILVFAFILTIIFSWGMGGFKGGGAQPGVIATVNGDEISYEEFRQQYQVELRNFRDQYGQEPQAAQIQQIENRVFETLVQQRLMADVINEMNLTATDEEIVEQIYNDPPQFLRSQEAFLDSAGNFSMERYRAALQNPGTDWTPVENYVRMTLPYGKLDGLLRASAVVSDTDVRMHYMKQNLKAKADYIFYDASDFSSQRAEPTDEEIQAYYQEHKEDYRKPEQRRLEYVLFETTATPSDSQEIYEQAEELMEEARQEGNFEELARIYSQDAGTAEKGGDLGFFGRGSMVESFEEAAFAASPGEIVGPVESRFGVHVIKVEDRRRKDGEVEVKARHILLKYEATPQTREALREEAAYISEFAKEADFRTVAESEGVEVQSTPPFGLEDYIPQLGMEPSVNRFAFRSQEGDVSPVMQIEKGFLVCTVAEVIKEHIEPLDVVRNQIVSKLTQQKQKELAGEKAMAAYERLQSGAAFDEVARQDSLRIQTTERFGYAPYIKGVGEEPRFAGAAFALEEGEFSKPVEGTRGYYIIQLLERDEFDEQQFANMKEALRQQLMARKKQMMYARWYEEMKEQADIEDFRTQYL
jgi:parvulin-like peptidyl-prolyl isomerase